VLNIILLGTALSSFAQSYLQQQNSHWLTSGEGIRFVNNLPQSVSSSWQGLSLSQGCASISDEEGNLLFYSDGNVVWDKNNDVMLNGWDINNNNNLAPNSFYIDPTFSISSYNFDGVVIMPLPGSSHKYLLFASPFLWTANGLGYMQVWTGQLFCTVIDMELNNGLGAVDSNHRGELFAESMAGNLHAVVGNDCNYWLLGYSSTGSYRAYEVTEEGPNPTPVVSTLSPPTSPNLSELNLSPDRRKVAMAMGNEIQVCDFDPATGIFSNDVLLGGQESRYVAFSPNSQ